MEKVMSKTEAIKRYILFIISLSFISMGIVLTRHSGLGVSTGSSIPNVVSLKFDFLTLGTWLNIWNVILVIAQIIILQKDFRIGQLLQIFVALLSGLFTDLFMIVIIRIPMVNYLVRFITVVLGVMILSTGVSLSFTADVMLNPAEAFVKVVARKLNKNIGDVKIAFDVFCVIASIVLSLIFFDVKIAGVREGTIIAAVLTGSIVKALNNLTRPPIESFLSK